MAARHIELCMSSWNTPIFVIQKRSGKWQILQDLRAVNMTMVPMGALQPGLPSPVAIPREHVKLVIDLKDCFFSIPLYPEDCKCFAFSSLSPQGMTNSPTLCQKYVTQIIDPFRMSYPDSYIIHYMDDILLAGPDEGQLYCAGQKFINALQSQGLQISSEKIQIHPHICFGALNCFLIGFSPKRFM